MQAMFFFYQIIICKEKWYLFINMKQHKGWLSHGKQATPCIKQILHLRKTMLCMWWNCEEIIHYELFEKKQTVNVELFVQLIELLNMVRNRQHRVILLHGNAHPHFTHIIKETIQMRDWKMVSHPLYSPNWALIGSIFFYLFQMVCVEFHSITMQNWEFSWMDFSSWHWVISTNNVAENPVEHSEWSVNNKGEYIIDLLVINFYWKIIFLKIIKMVGT